VEELSVVGLDLVTGREVTVVDEHDVPFWRRKGLVGDQTLICVHCFDGAEDGVSRRVPLVARGRIAGRRRAHFAHPPGMSPRSGEHHPETVWHANGKQRLAAWARRRPGVVSATVEAWTSDGRRRCDVSVQFRGGGMVALELQAAPITDDEWLRRHHDYRRLGVADVWLWRATSAVPGILQHHEQPGWVCGDDLAQLRALVALPHPRPPRWWEAEDLRVYGWHWPPHPDDRTVVFPVALDDVQLTRAGLQLPEATTTAWRADVSSAALCAARSDTAPPEPHRSCSPSETMLSSPTRRSSDIRSAPIHTLPERNAPRSIAAVIRVDARSPDCDESLRQYLCRLCNVGFGCGAVNAHRECVIPV
jgi:hypothetical protein